MQNNSKGTELRISDSELKLWEECLPKGYERKIKEEMKLSLNFIQRVKRGKRYNIQVITILNNLANANKKRIESISM